MPMMRVWSAATVHKLTCPVCRESGEIGNRSRGFEPRGTLPDSATPVYRCINCGCGVAVTQLRGWYAKRFAWGRRPLAEAGLVSAS